MAERYRLGVALLIEGRPADEIDGLRRALGDPSRERIAPHITLVSPFNTKPEGRDAALSVLSMAGPQVGPLTLDLGPPESFSPANDVVYLRVGADSGLTRLHRSLQRTPFDRSSRWEWVPHVTIAEYLEPERIPLAVSALSDFRMLVHFARVSLLWHDYRAAPGERRWKEFASVPLHPQS